MKQRDKKKEHINTKRRRQSSSTLSLPLDLILEILLRLPAKSVVRFRSVSKPWFSITTDQYFTTSFESQSLARPSLLMFFKKSDKLFVFSFPNHYQNSNETYSSQHVYSYHMTYPNYCCFSFTESVHGLICFRKSAKPIVWNPTMRQFLSLPKPEKAWKDILVFLGFDPIEHKHKVICLPRSRTCDECRVLTLGSAQGSWRTVKTDHKHRSFYRTYGRCINGVLYYPAYNQTDVHILMSFDVRFEKFKIIEFPPGMSWSMLIPIQGMLACVEETNDGIALWILESPEKQKWSRRHFLAPLSYYYKSLKTDFKLVGITHAGEFFYVPSRFHKSFYILYYDPEIKKVRTVEFEGIADDDFRLSNGLGNKGMNRLHTFQNHIQSLMSL